MLRNRRLLAALALLVALVAGLLVAEHVRGTRSGRDIPSTSASGKGPVILVGTGGFTWEDVSRERTPGLWALLEDGATGDLAVKTMWPTTCPTDGWASLSAGESAGAPRREGYAASPCPQPRAPEPVAGSGPAGGTPGSVRPATVPGFDAIKEHTAKGSFEGRLGLLGDTLARDLKASPGGPACLQAIGSGAALAAATSDGRVAAYAPWDEESLDAALARCPVTLVDVGSVDGTADRAAQVRDISERVQAVRDAAPADATIVVAALADGRATEGDSALRPVAVVGAQGADRNRAVPRELLTSRSTRVQGVVQLSDLTATLLDRAGVPLPSGVGGRALQITPNPEVTTSSSLRQAQANRAELMRLNDRAIAMTTLVLPYLAVLYVALLVVLGAAALAWRRVRAGSAEEPRRRLLGGVELAALAAACVPYLSFRMSTDTAIEWASGTALAELVLWTIACGLVTAAIVRLGRPSLLRPAGLVALVTAAWIGLDVASGSVMQATSIFGLQPLIGGRFYGMGNVAFAIYAVAVLVGLAALVHWLRPTTGRLGLGLVIAAFGLLAVAVDVAPMWGNDVGGPLGFVPALAVFAFAALGIRATWTRWALVIGGTIAAVAALGFVDHLRPEASRTHLGRFVDKVLDGSAVEVVWRKLEQNIELLTDKPWLLVVGLPIVAVCMWMALSPRRFGLAGYAAALERAPELRAAVLGILVMAWISALLNDSGAAIPGTCTMLTVPLVVAVSARAMRSAGADREDSVSERG